MGEDDIEYIHGQKPIWEAEWQSCTVCGQMIMTTASPEDALCDFHWMLKYRPDMLPRCPYCSEIISGQAEWDHIIPISKGGRTVSDNMVLCCRKCNRAKGNMTPKEWLGHDVDFSRARFRGR